MLLKDYLEASSEEDKEDTLNYLFRRHDPENILKMKYDEDKNEFLKVVRTLLNEKVTLSDIINEEFETLKINKSRCTDNFIKRRINAGNEFNLHINDFVFPLRIFSIDKIKTVTAQYGYQRNT